MKLPRPPRAKGISTALAIEAAQTANASCLASTYKTTTLVTDFVGVPIVVISNDGAAAITQRIAMTKAQAVLKYGTSSGEVVAKAGKDTALAAEIKANPLIDTARPGAYPIKAGSELVAIISVSGAPGGDKDEVCAQAGHRQDPGPRPVDLHSIEEGHLKKILLGFAVWALTLPALGQDFLPPWRPRRPTSPARVRIAP